MFSGYFIFLIGCFRFSFSNLFLDILIMNIKKQIGKGRSKATYQKYEVTKKHLKTYIQRKFSLNDILICKINHKFIWEFEIYLKTVANCGHNTTAKFKQFFKRIIRLALHSHYIKDDPFLNYEIKLHDVHREIGRASCRERV